MKIIFLDIDGVLNGRDFLVQQARLKDSNHLDPVRVARLNHLVEMSGAHCVISSDWRWGHSPKRIEEMFHAQGGSSIHVIGETTKSNESRQDQIKQWLTDHVDQVESFVVIDDMAELMVAPQLSGRLVLTMFSLGGLLEHDVLRAATILNSQLESWND